LIGQTLDVFAPADTVVYAEWRPHLSSVVETPKELVEGVTPLPRGKRCTPLPEARRAPVFAFTHGFEAFVWNTMLRLEMLYT
jgi:hypothetical protein